MAFWNVDLTTRAGAKSAAYRGSLACFVFSGFAVLGGAIALFGIMDGAHMMEMIGAAIGVGVEIVVALIAGLRLRIGKGAIWGGCAAALLIYEMIFKLVTMTGVSGIIINGFMLILIVNGIRGALALKKAVLFEDDEVEVFS